jgi:RNA polymerase sigma-70 factor (ECF subfamily)
VILSAANSKDPGAQDALASLCHIYWHPIYAYIFRRGYKREDAQDLTQGFFTQLLEKKQLKAARSDRGRFRSFLLASVKNYLANEWDRERAQKRGGGKSDIPLDFNGVEALWIEPADPVTPESIFERRWALTVLAQVMDQLSREMVQSGHKARFVHLRGFLTGEDAGLQYKQAADELKMSEGAVRVAVHRLRRRFGEFLRREVARTIDDPKQVDDEIRYLFSTLSDSG